MSSTIHLQFSLEDYVSPDYYIVVPVLSAHLFLVSLTDSHIYNCDQ
jgi:hypothetical protein